MPEAAKVHHLETPIRKVVASATEIVVGLADNRQMRFSTGFEGDEPMADVVARFDRIFAIADHYEAKYQIESIEKDLRTKRETLSQYHEDRARIDADHEHQQAVRRVELQTMVDERPEELKKFTAELDAAILKMREARGAKWQEGYAEFNAGGRGGAYKPRGQNAVTIQHIDREIEKATESKVKAIEDFERDYDERLATARAEIDKRDAERDQALTGIDISIKRFNDSIAEDEDRLEKCRAKMRLD